MILGKNVSAIAQQAFSLCTGLKTVVFKGAKPTFANDSFTYVNAEAYYPASDSSWNEASLQPEKYQFGGTITWKPYSKYLFDDVLPSESYFKYVEWAYDNGIVTGTSDKTFSPLNSCKRDQFATMLYRMNGKPAVTNKQIKACPFTDISALSTGVRKAIVWAYDTGIVTGKTDTTYGPDGTLTRAQIAVMLYRMAGKPKVSDADIKNCQYTDLPDNSGVKKAIVWLNKAGIAATAAKYGPNNNCTRYQLVTMLYKYNKLYKIV